MTQQSGDFFRDLQQRQLDTMEAFQSAVSDTMRAWQDAFTSATRPSGEEGDGGPFGQLPSPTQVANAYFNFAEQMLARQHEFALRMIETVTPRT